MKKISKKGFTLVELIVVIAIIGILAAILVPTMLNYTMNAKVTSANNTAGSIERAIDNYLLKADIEEYGMFVIDEAVAEIEIKIIDSVWNVTATNTELYFHDKRNKWRGSGSGYAGKPLVNSFGAEEELAVILAGMYPELETGYIKCHLTGGDCDALYYTAETNTDVTMPEFGDRGWSVDTFIWDGANAGVCEEGYIVGTAPVLPLGSED